MLKKRIHHLLLSIFTACFTWVGYAQTCPNIDFSMGNFTNWQGRTGSCCPINLPTVGIVPGRHSIAAPGIDPNTCGGLSIPAPGFANVAQLGNAGTGSQAEGISYTYLVDPQTALLVYTYAVVMEDPGHSPADQPRFEIQVRDQFGNIIPCTLYEISAGGGIPGFQNCGGVQWKDWTQVGVDLTGYIGTNCTIEMRTGDCALGGHFGYGYIAAECQPLEIVVEYCQGDTVASLTAPAGFASYLWSTGETTQTIAINNPVPGVSSVTCDVTSVTGCTATLTAIINPVIVTAGFSYTDNCGLVQFTDTSTCTGTGSIVNQWNWDFDDAGATSALQNPSHQYNSAGTYDVQLIATSNIGCMDTVVVAVPVTALPTANFTVPTNCGLTNTFTDNGSIGGSSAITNFDWDFGDLSTGTGAPVTHTYANSGTWNVQLVVTNADGCTDTLVQPFTNRNYPVAAFTSPDICQYDTAHFLDQSVVANANIIDWDWTIAPAVQINNTQNPDYYYNTPGQYNVQLIVTTDEGCYDTLVQPLNIWDIPNAAYTVNDVCLGDGSVFTNTSNIANGTITTYTWDFGDPAFPDNGLQNPTIAYTVDGQYSTQLIVTSNFGCVDTATYTFDVWPMPDIDFTVDTLVACWPFTANFTNTTTINSGSIATYTWDLDYGVISNNTDESLMYPNQYDQYTITLSATSNYGCDTSITRPNYITVYPKPTADFAVNTPCLGDGSVFQDNSSVSSGTIDIYNWNFGNAAVANSALQNPVIAYPGDGTFNVELIITTNYGCQDSITLPATVWPMPEIDFTAGPLVGCYPFTVEFNNLTTINSGTVNYTWDLDDGNPPVGGFEPSILYPNFENNYTITLYAVSNHGCDTSLTRPNYITVHPKPTASFTYNPTDLNVIDNVIHTTNLSVLGDNYFWDFGTGDVSTNFEDYYQYTGDTGIYTITLVTTTNFGCVDTADAIVHIKPIFTIYIPNTFTPNYDGLNDNFMVYGYNLQDVTMRIFDRWGEEIATLTGTDPVLQGWNGQYKNQLVKQDVYVYRVEVIDIFGDFHEFVGQVNLIR
jgi:gliding motility-associated-like protein